MTLFSRLLRVALPVYAGRHGTRLEYRNGTITVSQRGRTVLIPQRHAVYGPDLIANFDAYRASVRDSNGMIDFSSPGLFEYRDSGLEFWLPLAPLISELFFLSSVQLFFVGIVGEYIGSIYTQVRNHPHVFEKERINFDDTRPVLAAKSGDERFAGSSRSAPR